jgi:hypothetical protein
MIVKELSRIEGAARSAEVAVREDESLESAG